MNKVVTWIISLLALLALGALGTAIYGQYELIVHSDEIQYSQRFPLLSGIAVSAGVLIAALTFLREQGKLEEERKRHASEIFLAQANEGFETVLKLLSDTNNDRITWVRAARTLLRATQLARQIESAEYKTAYELQKERVRSELYMILTILDPNTGKRSLLPPQFFYGIENWQNCKTLDEAAVLASAGKFVTYNLTIDSVPPQPIDPAIPPQAVVAIFDFIENLTNQADPLVYVPIWGSDWQQSHDIDQGARRYVAHRKQGKHP